MKIARLAGLVLVAVMAMGLVAASVASAEPPLFKLLTGTTTKITGTSGVSTLSAASATDVVSCKKSVTNGEITSKTLLIAHIHYLECEGAESGKEKCPVMSPGAPAANLILVAVIGHIGLALSGVSSTSDAAALLLPSSGTAFVTLLAGVPTGSTKCILETKVTGTVAGLLEPVGKESKTGTITLGVTGGKQNIKEVDVTNGGLVKPKLTAFSTEATQEQLEELEFSPTNLEVT